MKFSAQVAFDFRSAVPAFCDPLVKYAGSKRWLVKLLANRLHAHLCRVGGVYVEPFAGSFAVGLSLGWADSVYVDVVPDVVNLHRAVRDDAAAVSREVDALRGESGEATYYRIRESVWPGNREKLSSAALAARTIWLNKNCFNGLTRYSRKEGKFNVPWGKREGVALPSTEHVARASRALRGSEIARADFGDVIAQAVEIDPRRLVVYLDPPYAMKMKNVSTRGAVDRGGTSKDVYTGYAGKFTWADQVRLAAAARGLAARGALVIASNSWTDEVCDLYRDGFALFQVGVQHSVGATGERRGRRAEMIAVSEAHAGVLESVPAKIVRRRG